MNINVYNMNILNCRADAMILPANPKLIKGGGLSGLMHDAAGYELEEECQQICKEPLEPGSVVVTKAYNLLAKHVFHAVGPQYDKDNPEQSATYLANCYRNIAKECINLGLNSLAIPAISCGLYGYPWKEAAHIAVKTIYWAFKQYEKDMDKNIEITFCMISGEYVDQYTEELAGIGL
jgi:O-acetyl-ADP-ribose deacetylase (regulator of RNase III)